VECTNRPTPDWSASPSHRMCGTRCGRVQYAADLRRTVCTTIGNNTLLLRPYASTFSLIILRASRGRLCSILFARRYGAIDIARHADPNGGNSLPGGGMPSSSYARRLHHTATTRSIVPSIRSSLRTEKNAFRCRSSSTKSTSSTGERRRSFIRWATGISTSRTTRHATDTFAYYSLRQTLRYPTRRTLYDVLVDREVARRESLVERRLVQHDMETAWSQAVIDQTTQQAYWSALHEPGALRSHLALVFRPGRKCRIGSRTGRRKPSRLPDRSAAPSYQPPAASSTIRHICCRRTVLESRAQRRVRPRRRTRSVGT